MKIYCRLALSIVVMTTTTAFSQTISVTKYGGSNAQGGISIQAEYDQGPNPWCLPENVRWLQRILLKKGDGVTQKDDVPGYPSGDFIDPQPGQPGGPWDNSPWYDVTYNSAADRNSSMNQQGGKGRFMNDSPSGWGPFGPMYFCAWTAVVCIDTTTKKASYMGGFTWGFCVTATGGIVGNTVQPLLNDAATAGIFNGALGKGPAGFKEWSVMPGDPQCQLRLNAVPEPSAMLMLGGLAAGVMRRRKRAA